MQNNNTTFDLEDDFEKAFIDLLKQCGWEKNVIEYPTENDLLKNWANILYANNRDKDRLADYPLTDGEMKQILEQINTQKTPYKLNGFINGKTVRIKRDNEQHKEKFGKEVSLNIYDRLEIAGGKSRYQIVRQPKFKVSNAIYPNRRGDVMLLINGMPVFHIELKRSGVPISQAWNQIEKYSNEHIFTGIFSLVQIFIAMTPDDAVYFTNPGYGGRFNQDFYFHWENSDNVPITNWKDFTQNLLYIPMAHQIIGFYTVADAKDGILKVLRSYQYYAVSAITNKVKLNHWEEKKQRGGYIWHTTGSGKTLTSFKAADLISKSQDADKVVFLVDRKELDTQSVKHYRNFADDDVSVQNTENTGVLITKLKSSDPSDSLIVTSIQKMSRIFDDGSKFIDKDIEIINKKRLVFIIDECHRDTFGEMMSVIKNTFKKALYFGFTGTPIQEENSKKGCTSSDVFGDELHRYTIGDGIRDGNVLGFDPNMVNVFEDEELKVKIAVEMVHAKSEQEAMTEPAKKDKYFEIINNMKMAGYCDDMGNYHKDAEDYIPESQYTFDKRHPNDVADKYVNSVIDYILKKYDRVSHCKKFHSIFATSSIPEALEYYKRFKLKAPELKIAVLVDPSDTNSDTNFDKIQGLAEIIKDYNDRYKTHYTIATYSEMKKDISLRLSHEQPYENIDKKPEEQVDMLIVVNQMLTGFDSKWVNALYLDKLMKQENIIQAFSRTNRIFNMTEKPVGIIYYFRRPHTMKRNIEEAVKMYSGDKAYMVFVDKLEKNLVKFNGIFTDIKTIFEDEKIYDFAHLPKDMSARVKFAHLFNNLSSMLEMIKVQDFTWDNLKYGDITVLLNEEIYYILLQRYKELFIKGSVNPSEPEPPYDLNPHITEISTGKIDADYMNSRFEKYLKLKLYGQSKQDIDEALQSLYKSFAMLSEEEQKYAEIFIKDVQLGNIIPENGKTFRDYITEYMKMAKDRQINRFAQTFGIDNIKLAELMKSSFSVVDDFSEQKLKSLISSVDIDKVIEYYQVKQREKISSFKAKIKIDALIRQFVMNGGFDLD